MTRKNKARVWTMGPAAAMPEWRNPVVQPVPMPAPSAPVEQPVEMPAPSQAPPRIAEPALIDTDVQSSAERETYTITPRALDYFYDRAQAHYVRLNSMGAALKRAGRELKERIVQKDGVFDLRPLTSFESYLASRAAGLRDGAPQEPPDVAARRRDWDEAKRSGDAGAMTRTANALSRAVEEARGHLEADRAVTAPSQEGVGRSSSANAVPGTAATNTETDADVADVLREHVLDEAHEGERIDAFLPLGDQRNVIGEHGITPLGWWPDWWSGEKQPNRIQVKTRSAYNKGGTIRSQRDFELDQPSRRGGYIIQEVTITFRRRRPDGSLGPPEVLYHYWEAWKVEAREKSPRERKGPHNDSVKFERGAGGGGRVEIVTRTRFYEGLHSLPPQFKKNKDKGHPDWDPTIDPAGKLLATSEPFELAAGSYESVTPAENVAIDTEW